MFALDQTLAGTYRSDELRAEARRDGDARRVSPSLLRVLARRLAR